MSQYEFFTRWEVYATPEEVYRTLEDVNAPATWWPSVYLNVRVLEEGNSEGVGKRVDLYWAMHQGEISLRLELLRRRSTYEAERNMIPAPPRPTFVKKRQVSR